MSEKELAATLAAPIDVEDVRIIEDGTATVLPLEKFEALVEYVGQLEGALRFTDFEFDQERRFGRHMVEYLLYTFTHLRGLGHPDACHDIARGIISEVDYLERNGVVREESAELLRRSLSEVIKDQAREAKEAAGDLG